MAQRPVAIKAYVHEKPTHSQALVDEYTRLRALDHRNIVQALELFRDEAGIARAFSMEWLEGLSPIQWVWRDLSEGDPHALSELQTLDFDDGLVLKHVRDRAKTNVKGGRASSIADLEVHRLSMRERERLEHLAAQLFDALAYLREAHVIHGDIKHSNLRVIDGGRLVLFDFGAVPLLREQLAAYEFSPDYAAPEVLHGALPTFSSEVYSAAVVLFETATRRRFCTSSRKSFHFRLRELRRSGVDISLARGIATCLSSDPRNRPLASEFQRWFARRRLRFSGALSHENLSDQGTQQQVAEVVSARLRETAGELVVLMGDTGTAKTTIAAQIVSAWTDQPRSLVIWIGGQPSNQDSYHSLRDLVQGLEDASRAIDAPGLRDAWHEAENDPVFRALMRRRHVIEPDPLALHLSSDTQAQFRVLDRIGRLFQLVSQAHELLVVFDDLEWLDADSYLAFQTMMTRPQSPPRVRFLVTTRPSSSTFQRLDQVVEAAGRPIFLQRLEPLTPRDQFLLVQEIIGEAPSDALMTSLHSVCRGHASMLTWVSRWLVEAERIEGPPPSLSEIVAAKLDALLDHERQLIELMAVANHPLPTRVLAHFADEPILEVITKLEVLGLVEPLSPRSPDEYTLPQATLRHVILAGLNDEKQQELLTLLVPVLASEMRASSEYIGKLWIRLGHEKEGRKWLLQAAHDAHRQLGFFKAAELYREVLARSPQEERPAIHLQLAEAYEQLGELTRAAGHLLEASRQVETGRSIDLRTQAAELLFTAGADARARHVLERVLENLNCAPYPGMLKQGRTWLKERGAFLRYIESNDILTLLEERSASDSWHLRRIKAYHLASTVLGQHSLPRALFYHQQSARLTLRGAPAPLVRAVLGWEMVFVAMPGPIFRGQLVALQTAFDTLSEAPFSLTARDRMHMLLLSGTAALGIGRTSDAIRHYERTLTIYFEEYVRAPWTALTSTYILNVLLIRELRLQEAKALSERLLDHLSLEADAHVHTLFDLGLRCALARAEGDLATSDALLTKHAHLSDTSAPQLATFWWLENALERGLYTGRSAEALRAYGKQALRTATSGLLFAHYLSVELLFALARALLDARHSEASTRERLAWRAMLATVYQLLARLDTPQATQLLLTLRITEALQNERFTEALKHYALLQRVCRDDSGVALLVSVQEALESHGLTHRFTQERSSRTRELLLNEGIADPARYLRALVPSRLQAVVLD